MTTQPTTAPERPMTVEEARGYIALAQGSSPGEWRVGRQAAPRILYEVVTLDPESGEVIAEDLWLADAELVAAAPGAIQRLATAWLAEEQQLAEASRTEESLRETMSIYLEMLERERASTAEARQQLAEAKRTEASLRESFAIIKVIHEETLGQYHLDNERLKEDVRNWRGQVHMSEETVSQVLEKLAEARAEVERLQTILRRCTDVGCRWAGGEAAGLDKPEEAGR